eukprot:scaffold14368_cov214-Skeletonema_dohrnii-CCMP3373.AAC.1
MARAMGSAGVCVCHHFWRLRDIENEVAGIRVREKSFGQDQHKEVCSQMRILSPCDAKQRSEPNRGEVWRLRHTGAGAAMPLTNRNSVVSKWKCM